MLECSRKKKEMMKGWDTKSGNILLEGSRILRTPLLITSRGIFGSFSLSLSRIILNSPPNTHCTNFKSEYHSIGPSLLRKGRIVGYSIITLGEGEGSSAVKLVKIRGSPNNNEGRGG